MKLTEENFQIAVKVGAVLLAISTVANVYFLLRHREVYRDQIKAEAAIQQQSPVMLMQQQALEGILREFALRAASNTEIAAIFHRYQSTNTVTTGAKP
jgi:hypothetical protein